jgi:pilus biogenesis lipoprotein CpaD
LISALLASLVAACAGNPTAQQAAREQREEPVRADAILAIDFRAGVGYLEAGQVNQVRAMVSSDRSAERDEYVVVTGGGGGALQNARAQHVRQSLAGAGARWVSASVEPGLVTSADQIVVVRSKYRIAEDNCPNYSRANIANTNESADPGLGCANAYNFGQMLARPRDAAIGRRPGPADGTVGASAVERYRAGQVRSTNATGTNGTSVGGPPGAPN